jgi:hypothetical protein
MKPFFKSVLLTTLFVGTTDLLLAYTSQFGKTGNFPEKMLLYIAGGAFGPENTLKGGVGTEFIGLFFHFLISFLFTLFFYLVYPVVRKFVQNIYLTGILYAVFVGTVMNFIVLPLSKTPPGDYILSRAFLGWILLGIVFGIPIVYFCKKFYEARRMRSEV